MLLSEFDGFSGKVSFRCDHETTCSQNGGQVDGGGKLFEGDRAGADLEFFVYNYNGGAWPEKYNLIGVTRMHGKEHYEPVSSYPINKQLLGVKQTRALTWPASDNQPHDESMWLTNPLNNVQNFRVSILLRNASGTSKKANQNQCMNPEQRDDQNILLEWTWCHKNPTYFLVDISDQATSFSSDDMEETAEEKENNFILSLLVHGDRRNVSVSMGWSGQDYPSCSVSDRLSASETVCISQTRIANKGRADNMDFRSRKVWSARKYAQITAVKTRSFLTSRSKSLMLSQWETTKDCASLGKFLNETDCNPMRWNCLACPEFAQCGPKKRDGLCEPLRKKELDKPSVSKDTTSAGGGGSCGGGDGSGTHDGTSTNTKAANSELKLCFESNTTCIEECGGRWWGGDTINEWIEATPGTLLLLKNLSTSMQSTSPAGSDLFDTSSSLFFVLFFVFVVVFWLSSIPQQ